MSSSTPTPTPTPTSTPTSTPITSTPILTSFPKGFLLGSATSAHQIEGGWQDGGKGLNMWDYLSNYKFPDKDNGNDACKSYPDNYKEDVKLLKEAGFHFYRFSMSWTRLLPDGELTTKKINQKGITYYKNLIKELKDNNIEPVVTIYHWDLPHKVQDDFGGWTNPRVIDFLEDYADFLFKTFGDSVKYWITINEPTLILHGYENGETLQLAPGKSLHSPGNFIVIHNLMKAHARLYHLYDKNYRPTQKGQIGISLVGTCYRPKNPESKDDIAAVERAYAFYLGLFANPIFTEKGGYPEIVRKIVDKNSKKEGRRRSRLPEFTEDEKKALIGSSDFFGVNHYLTEKCSPATKKYGFTHAHHKEINYCGQDPNPMECFREDINCRIDTLDDPEPSGFRELLKYIKDNYQNPPIFVTENGLGVNVSDSEDDPGTSDPQRAIYYKNFMTEMLKAIYEDKCNVIAYTAWSLLDNFEWSRGYAWKYGLVHVDFEDENRKRTPKSSYYYFQKIIKDGHL